MSYRHYVLEYQLGTEDLQHFDWTSNSRCLLRMTIDASRHTLSLCKPDQTTSDVLANILYPFRGNRQLRLFVDVDNTGITINIAGSCALSVQFDTTPLIAAAISSTISFKISDKAKEKPESSSYQIHCGGKKIKLPVSDISLNEQLFETLEEFTRYQKGFLTTRVFAAKTACIERLSPDHLGGLMHALYFPVHEVYALCESAQEHDYVQQLAKLNQLPNLKPLFCNEALTLVRCGTGTAQGQNNADYLLLARGIFGGHFEQLLSELRQQGIAPSFYASETEICNGVQIYAPDQTKPENIHLHVRNQPWVINAHRYGHYKMRRPGLDIIVNAHTARWDELKSAVNFSALLRPDIHLILVMDEMDDSEKQTIVQGLHGESSVKIVYKSNDGPASARNYGRMHATASHLAFVDYRDRFSAGFHADLYDLALHCGAEMVQGGANPTLQRWLKSTDNPVEPVAFGKLQAYRLPVSTMFNVEAHVGQHIYRHDYLDAKNIYFPESMLAFSEQYVQFLAMSGTHGVALLPAQDYSAGTPARPSLPEDYFYQLYMFRQLLLRSVDEGWNKLLPLWSAILLSLKGTSTISPASLQSTFIDNIARLVAVMEKIYGRSDSTDTLTGSVQASSFHSALEQHRTVLAKFPESAMWAHLQSMDQHPNELKMMRGSRNSSAPPTFSGLS